MIKFSIVVINENSEKNIKRFLNNILNQTYKNYELIILDNGSTDNSKWIINDFFIEHNDIINYKTLNYQEKKSVLNNKCLKMCTGDYVTFLSGDMNMSYDYLAKVKNMIDSSQADLVIPIEKKCEEDIIKTIIKPKILIDLVKNDSFLYENKFFSKRIIKESNFSITKTRYGEDFYITMFVKADIVVLMEIKEKPIKDKLLQKYQKHEIVNKFEMPIGNIVVDNKEKIELLNGLEIILFLKRFNKITFYLNKKDLYIMYKVLELIDDKIPNWYTNIYFNEYKKILNPYLLKIINAHLAKKENNSVRLLTKY